MVHSDLFLIEKIQNGDQRAFKQLYDRYGAYALRSAYAILKNKYDAADVVQETFIRIYQNIGRFDTRKPFRPWFYQILFNECKRFMARKAKQPLTMSSEETFDYFKERKPAHGGEKKILLEALENLEEDDRTIIVLKYLEGFKEKELAQMLNINVNTLKSRLYRARQRLKNILSGELHDE